MVLIESDLFFGRHLLDGLNGLVWPSVLLMEGYFLGDGLATHADIVVHF